LTAIHLIQHRNITKNPSLPRTVSRYLRLGLLALLFNLFLIKAAAAVVVDIMIVYDTKATAWVAANGGMAAVSQDAVNRMSQALQNSGLSHSFRLVHSMSVDYTTSSDGSTPFSQDLSSLQKGSGVFATVHTARDTYGADLVAMMVDTGRADGYVGVGYLLSSWSGSPDYGFTVNAIRSVEISHTLTHEVGHNLGAHHAKDQASDPGPNRRLDDQYSAGWYFIGTDSKDYHTIMAYNYDGESFYRPAPLFSTPLMSHQGTPAGDQTDGDNARLIDETIGTVAGYRIEETTTYNLTVNSSGAADVAITGYPTTYGGTTNYTKTAIPANIDITLSAPATVGSAPFSSWSNCNSTSGYTCTVSMAANKIVTANYTASKINHSAGNHPAGKIYPSLLMLLLQD
jgi:hypothetical protein